MREGELLSEGYIKEGAFLEGVLNRWGFLLLRDGGLLREKSLLKGHSEF